MARVTVFSFRPCSAYENENSTYSPVRAIKVRGGNPVYVAGTYADEATPRELQPRLTLYEDLAGHKPLCSIFRQTPGTDSGAPITVMAPDGRTLALLRASSRRDIRWPRYEIALPDGTRLAGRRGTVTTWAVYVALFPLLLAYNVLSFIGRYGGPEWMLPRRIAWRAKSRHGTGFVPLKFYGTTSKFKVRLKRMDIRVAYAQATLHDWFF